MRFCLTRRQSIDGNYELPVEPKPSTVRLVLEGAVYDDVALDCGQGAVEIDGRYLAATPQVLDQRPEGRRCIRRQPQHCLASRLRERTLVAGDRQQNQEDSLGIAGQLLNG